jgi:hypothetical protein
MLTVLYVSLMIEAAILEAIETGAEYTTVGFEADGTLVACIKTEFGQYWTVR